MTQKRAAQQVARARLAELELEAAGITPNKAVLQAASAPLPELFDRFIRAGGVRGTAKHDHLAKTRYLLDVLARECSWSRIADMTPESFCGWRSRHLAIGERSGTTLNRYLESVRAFHAWLIRCQLITENRFAQVDKLRGFDLRRERRSLSDAEQQRLLDAAGEHAALYFIVLRTGLRRREAASLRWCHVRLIGSTGQLCLPASVQKSGRSDAIELRADTVSVLRGLRGDAQDDDAVFTTVPSVSEFRRHLELAGIDDADASGRRVDFHALRTTAISNLVIAGVSPRLAQEFARHSDLKLTMGAYTDARRLPVREALDTLPPLHLTGARGTGEGTVGAVREGHSVSGGVVGSPDHHSSQVPRIKGVTGSKSSGVVSRRNPSQSSPSRTRTDESNHDSSGDSTHGTGEGTVGEVVDAWTALTPADRLAILAIVRTAETRPRANLRRAEQAPRRRRALPDTDATERPRPTEDALGGQGNTIPRRRGDGEAVEPQAATDRRQPEVPL
jgi:integrase